MAEIALSKTFVEALAALEPAGTKRTAAFLEKLLRNPDSTGIHSEPVRDAHDRSMRSMRVSDDLRAIARLVGDRLLLLFVGHHDAAYSWAQRHCVDCEPPDGGREISIAEIPTSLTPARTPATADSPAHPTDSGWFCTFENDRELCRALDAAGIEHGLKA